LSVVYLGIGSNIGNRFLFIRKALQKIKSINKTKIVLCSSLYETEPWGIKEQNQFLNCVLKIETGLTPDELLSEVKKIESELGRIKRTRWQEREIDIDILFYNDIVYKNDLLTIPHIGIADRKFVLIPLNEIAPELNHPVQRKKIKELIELTSDNSNVEKYVLPENEKLNY
jgi:2-amino-4-hydroxy-6-hydroxymethyldihydropteridine diphosphokinase